MCSSIRHALAAVTILCVSAAYAQTAQPPTPVTPSPGQDTTGPTSASSPHQREATGQSGAQEAAPSNGANPADASSPHQRSTTGVDRNSDRTRVAEATMDDRMRGVAAGTHVRSPAGETIGIVADVVPDTQTGRPGYVLVSTTAARQNTAIPYPVVANTVHDGQIVLDRARLEGAPHVSTSQLLDSSNTAWQKESDEYWSRPESAGSSGNRSRTPPTTDDPSRDEH